jgi:DNA-binding transcriptional LysR family regulator
VSVDVRGLQWAIVAGQHKSLRQAAAVLNIRQSTLSRGLRDLEYRRGAALFERSNGGTHPTIAGREFLDSAQHFVEDMEALTERLRARSQGKSGRLTIGVHTSLSAGNLRATLIEHHRRFPGVETQLVDGSSKHLISALSNSMVDLAFVVEGNGQWGGKSLAVWSERVVVALPDEHQLSSAEVLQWNDLREEVILQPKRGDGLELSRVLLNKVGSAESCHLVRHDVSLDRLLTLVGAGWGILLALEGATGAAYPGVSFRELNDIEGPTRLNFRAYWRQGNYNPSLRPFLDVLLERYPDLSAVAVET